MSKLYDDIDIKAAHGAGFWLGALAGSLVAFGLCLFAGLYVSGAFG